MNDMIAVTGASGHLGSVLVEMLPDAEPIGRSIPEHTFDAIIHTAAPDYRDDDAVLAFRTFNAALEEHIEKHPPQVLIVTGSWWQHGIGSCRDVLYTRLKDEQARTFPQAVHLLPYSIYGDEPRPGPPGIGLRPPHHPDQAGSDGRGPGWVIAGLSHGRSVAGRCAAGAKPA